MVLYSNPTMEREKKPDVSGHVNGLDIYIFKLNSGIEISLEQEGSEVVSFRYNPQGVRREPETVSLPSVALPVASPPPFPTQETQQQPQSAEVKAPVKISGTIEEIEGLGQTQRSGDPVFRFKVKRTNPSTGQEDSVQIAAFREIAQGLHGFHTSPDPNVKLQPGRQISMMAWDHTKDTGSYYPSKVEYLNFPPLIYPPKTQKRR